MADTDARPVNQDALVADIDRTRAELARTIDAISDRVSPKRNVNRAMGEVRQRVNQVGQRVNQQVGQRASQVTPLMAGAAAAPSPSASTTCYSSCAAASASRPRRPAPRPSRRSLVSSSYSAADSRSGGSAASPLPSWARRTRNIQPALYGVGVDQGRGRPRARVDLGDLAVHRRVQVADGLGRLDLAAGLLGGDGAPGGGQRHVDHIAQQRAAKSVMPTVAVVPSTDTHSCSAV